MSRHVPANKVKPEAESSTGRVGIVTNSFGSAFYSCLIESASNYLAARGFDVVVQSKRQSPDGEREALTALDGSDCDGFIIHADALADEELNPIMQRHPNAVMLNRHLSLYPDRCVDVDNTLGGEIAARFLISQGHSRICMVRGIEHYIETQDRSLGFKRELKKHNLELKAELPGDFLQKSGELAMEQIHAEHPDITAVFCQNDEMAFGALNTCRRLGLRVPDDISIIGFDGIPMCEYVSPRLTSVQQPLRELGEHAAQIVCDLLLGVEPDKRTVGAAYEPVLAERETVSPPAGHSLEKIMLTQREAECLTWTAYGKTSWEISVIIGVSESTATFHLRNAGAKLKASNRAHAVAKALHLGLIEFSQE